jgi:hypothetical protein
MGLQNQHSVVAVHSNNTNCVLYLINIHIYYSEIIRKPLNYTNPSVSGFSGLVVNTLASGTQVRGSNPAEAVIFFGRKNPQHAFLRRGSKAVCPMSQLCGMSKNPAISWKSDFLAKFDRLFLTHTSSFR